MTSARSQRVNGKERRGTIGTAPELGVPHIWDRSMLKKASPAAQLGLHWE